MYDFFAGVKAADLARYMSVDQIQKLMREAGFKHVCSEVADHIQRVFVDDDVFNDPFLVRESTSQLLMISDAAYWDGRRAIARTVHAAKRQNVECRFEVNLNISVIFGTAPATSHREM